MTTANSQKRVDSLRSQMHILLSIHNILVTTRLPLWKISQEELAEYLGIGERTLQRTTSELEKMGFLCRYAGTGRNEYVYSIPEGAIDKFLADYVMRDNVYLIRTREGCLMAIHDFETYMDIVLNTENIEQ